MALTPASILADYSSGIGTQGATLKINTNEKRVGIGTTNPQGTLQVGTAITMGSGIITATSFDGNTATFSGNVSVGGTLTYEDVTSVDSVGIITARQDIHVGAGLSVVGVSTFNGITTSTTTLFANNFSVSGVSTLGGNVVVGGATTELVVTGDARVTGILTVGTASLTLNGTTGAITGGSLTNAQVAAINTSIVGTGTTVDVFVYDTRKDSDGGAWRKRTQHTSWYNETLNTSTRGSRREFPSVAVIVAETDKVTIYDGDDPDLPMWMVFNESSNASAFNLLGYSTRTSTAVAALNAEFMFCSTGNQNQTYFNLISDYGFLIYDGGSTVDYYNGNIGQRNDGLHYRGQSVSRVSGGIVDRNVNDVAMTVLPNAPIDPATGLPVPTIAVGTDAVLSVINNDGTVVDYTGFGPIDKTEINSNYVYSFVHTSGNDYVFKSSLLSADGAYTTNIIAGSGGFYANSIDSIPKLKNMTVTDVAISSKDNTLIRSGNDGIEIFDGNVTTINSTQSIMPFAYISKDYNTGYMVGDIKGAFLSDTDATDATDSQRVDFNSGSDVSTDPVYGGVVGGTISNITTTSITIDATGLSGYKYYSTGFTPVSGKKYVAVITGSNYSGSGQYGLSIFGGWSINLRGTSNGTAGPEVTTSNGIPMAIFVQNGVSVTITLTIYELAEEDRSVNDNGLQVFGTITKSAVATSAELVGYSFATTSDYLEQPYNSDIGGVGTSDFSVMGWFKNSPAGSTWFDIASAAAPRFFVAPMYGATNDVWIYLSTSGSGTFNWNPGIGSIHNVSNWQFIAVKRVGTTISVSKNGSEWINNTSTAAAGDISGGNSVVTIGQNYGHGASAHTGQLALWRFSQSAPSAEQIKKIYEDEKVLFQENAKATLYGSSDAVTALAFDEDTNLLHVGTSSGRSYFQGLRRINNTTTAVTTAISASNGLVAEE